MSDPISYAAAAFRTGDLPRAESICRKLLGTCPSDHGAHLILGAVLARTGRLEQAIASLRQVLGSEPDSKEALKWMIEAHRRSGLFEEGLKYAERLVVLSPDEPDALFGAAMCFVGLGRYLEAESLLRRALRLTRRPNILHYLGVCLVRLDRYREAIPLLEEASAAEPGVPNHLVALGQAHLALRLSDRALEYAELALQLRPRDAEAELLMSHVLVDQGRFSEAETHIRAVLASAPGSSEANALMGMWLHQMGRFEEAEAYFDRALLLNPGEAIPMFFKVQHRRVDRKDLPLVEAMQQQVHSTSTPTHSKIALLYGLGKAWIDLEDPRKAFEYYDAANELSYEFYRTEEPYDVHKLRSFVDHTIELFTEQNLRRWSHVLGNPSERPIFIVGMIRSGTTLMEQLMSSHPEIAGAGELMFWPDHGLRMLNDLANDLEPAKVRAITSEFLELIQARHPTTRFVTDKMPMNDRKLGFIHAGLPNARIIHMERDLLDIALSIWMTFIRRPPDFANHKEHIIDALRQHERLREHWLQVLPGDRYLQVRYEDLTREPEAVMRKVLEFCDLEWNEACIHPERNERFVSTPSMYRVRRPIDAASVSKKERYGPYLGAFSALA